MRTQLALGILASALTASADVATSPNYALTIVSLDAGGGRSVSSNYVNDTVIGSIGGRAAVSSFYQGSHVGYAAELNDPPIALDDVRSHPFNVPIDLPGIVLLINDFDPDGDALQVLDVDPVSQASGAVSYARGRLQYIAPTNFTGLDRFNYSVIDANGDVDVGAVTVVVAPAASGLELNRLSLTLLDDSKLLLRLRTQTNASLVEIQTAPDLISQNWRLLQEAPLAGDGIFEMIIDPVADRQRYFQAVVF